MDEISSPSDPPENPVQQEQRRAIEAGTIGNPQGSKRSPNRKTKAVEALLDGEATAITCKVIEKALEGDMPALRLCFDRILPARRDRPMGFEMPKIETAADAAKASSAVLAACAAGELLPSEAAEVMDLVATHIRTLELTEIEARLTAVEKTLQTKKGQQP
jgi:hypothetical protein